MPTRASKDKPIKKKKEDNLKPFKKGQRTSEEQEKLAKKAGIASGEARRKKKILKDAILERLKEKDFNEMIDNLIARSKESDRSFEVLRDTIGQKPKEEIEATIDEVVIKVDIED